MFVVGGESLIDLVSEPRGRERVITLQAHQGGSPYNCAIALSRLGNETGFLCPISKDGFGAYLLEPLEAAGVAPLLRERVDVPTTLAVVTLDAGGKAQYEFYRGAERALDAATGIAALPQTLELFQFGGFAPIEPEDAAAWTAIADAAAARGAVISLDPNVRPSLLTDPDGYRQRLADFFARAHIVKVSEEDVAWIDADKSVEAHAEDLLRHERCELVVVTFGEGGSRAFTRAGTAKAGIYEPSVFGDTVGAGDTLMAGMLTWLRDNDALSPGALSGLDSEALGAMLRFGSVAAGLNCAEEGCRPPSRAEVDAALAEGG